MVSGGIKELEIKILSEKSSEGLVSKEKSEINYYDKL